MGHCLRMGRAWVETPSRGLWMFPLVPLAYHYPGSPALDRSWTLSPGQNVHVLLCVALLWVLLSAPGRNVHLGLGQDARHANLHAGSNLHKCSLVCSFPACPQNGTCKASRELFTALGREGRQALILHRKALRRWWLALLAALRGCLANLALKELWGPERFC